MSRRSEYDLLIIATMLYYPEVAEKLEGMGLKRGVDYIYTPVF